MDAMQNLLNLSFRLRFDTEGNYTFHAPEHIKFAVPLKDFQSTGITDQATGTVITITNSAIIGAVPFRGASGTVAERPLATNAGANADFYATDEDKFYKSNGFTWVELAKA